MAHNNRDKTVYENLLDLLQNEEEIKNLEFKYEYKEIENPETINKIINLMQRKASIVSVCIRGNFLQSITHETFVAFFDAILTLPNLQEISILCNVWRWEDCNPISLPILLREFVTKLLLEGRKLTKFVLWNLDVGDKIGAEIVKKLQNFKTLKHVTLRTLNLGNKTAFAIADWLKDSSCCLERIYLQNNPNIGPEGSEAICNALENNFILEYFWIWNNDRVVEQRCFFYTHLNRECNRYKMMRRVGNGDDDNDDDMVTRDSYINNMIETSPKATNSSFLNRKYQLKKWQNKQFYNDRCWEGSEDILELSLIYYWIRMNPFHFTINESY